MNLPILLCLIPLAGSFFTHMYRPRVYKSPVNMVKKNYPFSQTYYENYIKRLNSKNVTIQQSEIISLDEYIARISQNSTNTTDNIERPTYRVVINNGMFRPLFETSDSPNEEDEEGNEYPVEMESKDNLLYLLNLLVKADHKINREEIKDYRTALKADLY